MKSRLKFTTAVIVSILVFIIFYMHVKGFRNRTTKIGTTQTSAKLKLKRVSQDSICPFQEEENAL